MRIADLCEIQTGLTVRGRLDPDGAFARPCIQLRDVLDGAAINPTSLQSFDIGQVSDRYTVGPGDVIFKSRGQPNVACTISEAMVEPATVLLPLLILRPKSHIVTPDYLAWAINHPETQRQLDAEAQGTSLRMISKASLDNIEVPVPDLETQSLILEVASLSARESSLLHALADKKQSLSNSILADLANQTRVDAPHKGAH
jgi:hypothetical protein